MDKEFKSTILDGYWNNDVQGMTVVHYDILFVLGNIKVKKVMKR